MILSKYPPEGFNTVKLGLCKFRLKFYALNYGDYGGYGIAYEWIGFRLSIGRREDLIYGL